MKVSGFLLNFEVINEEKVKDRKKQESLWLFC
jgi:hypothetical protein